MEHTFTTNVIKDNFLNQNQTTCFETSIINSYNYYYFSVDIKYISRIISRSLKSNGFYISLLYPSLTQISIPSSVTKIGDYAFRKSILLTQIIILSSVILIGDYAFTECSSLAEIQIPSSVTEIGDHDFNQCSLLTQVTFENPSSVILIGDYAFIECSSLTEIEIPSSVTEIGNYAFLFCSLLTQITIPSSVTSIGNNVFNGIKSLVIKGDIQKVFNNIFKVVHH